MEKYTTILLSEESLPEPYNKPSFWYAPLGGGPSPPERNTELYYQALEARQYNFGPEHKSYFKIHLWLTRLDSDMFPQEILLENGQTLRAAAYAVLQPVIEQLKDEINTYKIRTCWTAAAQPRQRPIPDVVIYIFNTYKYQGCNEKHLTQAPERAAKVLTVLRESLRSLVTRNTSPGFKALFNAYPFADCPYISVMHSDTDTRYCFIKLLCKESSLAEYLPIDKPQRTYQEFTDFYHGYLHADEQFPEAKTRLQEIWEKAFTPDGCRPRYGEEAWNEMRRLLAEKPKREPCRFYNGTGCKRNKCPFVHVRVPQH